MPFEEEKSGEDFGYIDSSGTGRDTMFSEYLWQCRTRTRRPQMKRNEMDTFITKHHSESSILSHRSIQISEVVFSENSESKVVSHVKFRNLKKVGIHFLFGPLIFSHLSVIMFYDCAVWCGSGSSHNISKCHVDQGPTYQDRTNFLRTFEWGVPIVKKLPTRWNFNRQKVIGTFDFHSQKVIDTLAFPSSKSNWHVVRSDGSKFVRCIDSCITSWPNRSTILTVHVHSVFDSLADTFHRNFPLETEGHFRSNAQKNDCKIHIFCKIRCNMSHLDNLMGADDGLAAQCARRRLHEIYTEHNYEAWGESVLWMERNERKLVFQFLGMSIILENNRLAFDPGKSGEWSVCDLYHRHLELIFSTVAREPEKGWWHNYVLA